MFAVKVEGFKRKHIKRCKRKFGKRSSHPVTVIRSVSNSRLTLDKGPVCPSQCKF